MIRQSEAARTAAQFLSFGSFFLSCPLGLWDSCLFAQISFDRVLEVAVVDGLCVAGFIASLALGLGSMARGTARVPKPLAVAGALVYGMGLCLYAVIQGADVPVSAFGAAVMGAAIGAGLAVVVVGWCRLLARFGLRRSLVGLGIACGAAALAGLGFEMDVLPQPLSAFMAFALAGAVAPAIDSLRSSVESEESVVGDNAVEQDAPVEHLWDSMRTMVFNPCLGLCLFLFVMSARGFVFMGYEHIGASSVIVARLLPGDNLPGATAGSSGDLHRAEQLSRRHHVLQLGVPRFSQRHGDCGASGLGVARRRCAGRRVLPGGRGGGSVRHDECGSARRFQSRPAGSPR